MPLQPGKLFGAAKLHITPVNRMFCTRKQALAPSGLPMIADATELRLFMRRWRGCATWTYAVEMEALLTW